MTLRSKEYMYTVFSVLVTERAAPSCVFQTFAHPTSPRLSPCPQSRHGSLRLRKKVLLFSGFDSNIGKCIKERFNFHYKAHEFVSPAYQIMFF